LDSLLFFHSLQAMEQTSFLIYQYSAVIRMQWHISQRVISVKLHFSMFFIFIYWRFKCSLPVLLSYLSCTEFFSFFWKVMLCHCVHSCWSSVFRRITVTVPSLSCLWLLDPEDKGTVIHQKARICSPVTHHHFPWALCL